MAGRLAVAVVVAAGCGRLHFDARGDSGGGGGGDSAGDVAGDGPTAPCAAQIGAGRSHFCTVKGDHTVWCWGLGMLGQLGDGMAATHTSPVRAAVPPTATNVHGGRDETCAVVNGQVECWGENGLGQLGNNSTTNSPAPVTTAGLSGVDEVWPAAQHSCARAGTSIACWGDGSSGRLGTGNTSQSLVPVQVPSISTAIALSTGGSHSCAILADTSLLCWGYNASGQIGNNTTTDQLTPVAPTGLASAKAVSMRDLTTCAIRASDGGVMCWGRNDYGQVGDGTVNTPILVPTQVTVNGGILLGADEIASGIQHECARLGTELWCWGDNQYGQLGQPLSLVATSVAIQVPSLPPVARVSLSGYTTCILDTAGLVQCWGLGTDGQLGNGTTSATQVTPVLALDACM